MRRHFDAKVDDAAAVAAAADVMTWDEDAVVDHKHLDY